MLAYLALTALLVAAGAHAATHNVDVGDHALVFSPDTVTAAMGDTIDFHFYPGGHGVAESTFSAPCVPSGPTALFSGFFNPTGSEAKKIFSVTVNSTSPMWLYCPHPFHCGIGMAMVVNPPSGGSQTLAAYKKAGNGKPGVAPKKVQGGVVVNGSQGGGASTSSSAAPAATTSKSSGGGGLYGGGGGSGAGASIGVPAGLAALFGVVTGAIILVCA